VGLTRVALGTLGVVLVLSGSGMPSEARPGRGSGSSSAQAPAAFPLYDAGDRVDGLPLVAVPRRQDTAGFVSFVHGDCTARDDAGCAPPAEIQVWSACRRNLGLYDTSLPGVPVPEHATVRGVPAAFLDGDRLELQTGRSTVVVFGDTRGRILRIAAALRPVGERASPGPLPPPERGALDGTLGC
jgi:hypothetical protein